MVYLYYYPLPHKRSNYERIEKILWTLRRSQSVLPQFPHTLTCLVPVLEDTRRCINVGSPLVHRLRRWTNVKSTLIQRLVSAGCTRVTPSPYWNTNRITALKYFFINHGNKRVVQYETIIIVLVSCFIWKPMLRVCCQYKLLTLTVRGSSLDFRIWRLKTVPALKGFTLRFSTPFPFPPLLHGII